MRKDFEKFCVEELGITLHPYQKAMYEKYADVGNTLCLAQSPRLWGKSVLTTCLEKYINARKRFI